MVAPWVSPTSEIQGNCVFRSPSPPLLSMHTNLPTLGVYCALHARCAQSLYRTIPKVPPPRIQRTIKSLKHRLRTGMSVGHGVRYLLHSVPKPSPKLIGSQKVRSERKYSLDKAFVGQRGGGGISGSSRCRFWHCRKKPHDSAVPPWRPSLWCPYTQPQTSPQTHALCTAPAVAVAQLQRQVIAQSRVGLRDDMFDDHIESHVMPVHRGG